MNIILLGATGLVGNAFLQQVLSEGPSNDKAVANSVLYVGRKAANNVQNYQYCQSDLDDSAELEKLFKNNLLRESSADDMLVCCLGTTIKQAGSKSAFEYVDYELVLKAASAALNAGITRMMVISAVGADSKSRVFYSQIKGRVEKDLQALNFKQLILIKPSLLVGKRKEFRFAEAISEPLMGLMKPLLQGRAKKYRAVKGEDVAACMVKQLNNSKQGVLRVYPTDD